MDVASAPQLLRSCVAVMIDLDGTMVDTLGDFAKAIDGMLADLRLPPLDASHIEHMVGKGSEHLLHSVLTHVLSEAGEPNVEATALRLMPEAWDRYQWHYERINGQFSTLYPGVAEGIAVLAKAGYPMACLTNKPTAFAHDLLKAKGLHSYFSHVFGGDAFERKKPDPMPLVKTCEALGTQPAKTLMVGDSSNDAQAARGAGCPVVLVTYGYNHGEPIRAVNADAFVDSLVELSAT
ncbi:phosphoglycolate phosphatase [Diaphorobacter sp. HDW4A]|uniref:phosphoglycolate phosphatase n=1 Tax=Diaphorobacter sp. HDW4A TaxID=2714924 RepID=UPI00140DDFEB|nr:phosphoglycolate phosphatase [Diaphorobacter sp. HDW4A]QIL82090.1 phosphoglycolate phosphatase [Diaphorobacter sp. HDW4A]